MPTSTEQAADPDGGSHPPGAGAGGDRAWLPPLALLLLVVSLFHEVVLRGRVLYERDILFVWLSQVESFVGSVAAGSWPLWDPLVGFGRPLLPSDGQVLYPWAWLQLVMSPGSYYTLFVCAHLVLSGSGHYRLGRTLGLPPPAALGASLAWTASGALLSLVNVWHHFTAACWLPWVVLGAIATARRPGPERAGLWGLAMGLQILGGSPDMVALSQLTASAFLLAGLDWRRPTGAANRRVVAWSAAAWALALLGTAALWLPILETVRQSVRWHLPDDLRTAWSVHPVGLIQLLLPFPLADLSLPMDQRRALFGGELQPFLKTFYVGLPTVALAALGAAASRRRIRLPIVGLGAAAALFSLGPRTPVYSVMVAVLPFLRLLRYPSKAMVLLAFCWSLLVGLGLGACLDPWPAAARRWRRGALAVAAACVIAVAAVALLLSVPGLFDSWRRFTHLDPFPSDALRARAALAAGLSSLLALGVALLVVFRSGARRVATALLLVAVDLVASNRDINATAPPEILTVRPPLVGSLAVRDHSRLYVYDYQVPGKCLFYLGRESAFVVPNAPPDDPLPHLLAGYSYLPPPAPGRWGLEGSYDMDQRGTFPWYVRELNTALRALEGTPRHLRLLQVGAVSRVVALHEKGLEALVPVASLPSLLPEAIRIFRVPDPQPRSYAVEGSRTADALAAFQILTDPRFDPGREVILAEGTSRPAGDGFQGTSRILRLAPDRVVLEADLNRAGYVVLVDAYDPGWVASVDEAAAPLLRANLAFRAVAVPAGQHRIELVYRPKAFLVGLALSAATILGAAGALASRRRTRVAGEGPA